MTSPSPAEQFEAWFTDKTFLDKGSAQDAWLAAWSAAQHAQREQDMAVVAKALSEEIPGVDSLLERVLDALREAGR